MLVIPRNRWQGMETMRQAGLGPTGIMCHKIYKIPVVEDGSSEQHAKCFSEMSV